MVDWERRTDERVDLARPCKLYFPKAGRYVSGSTWNISAGGVLLQLDLPAHVEPGDRMFVGIALKRRQGVLTASEMFEAEVLRVLQTTDDRVAVAARFVGATADDASEERRAA
jgi:hypothetical protein